MRQDELSMIGVLNLLLRHGRWVVGAAALTAVVLLARAFATWDGEEFVASATFVAEQSGAGAEETALSRQLGLTRGGSSVGSPSYYAALATSRPLLRGIVDRPYRTVEDGDTITASLIEAWGVSRPTSEAGRRAAAGRLARKVDARVENSTGFVTVSVTAGSELLAEELAAAVVAELQRYNLQQHRARASDEARFLAEQLAAAQADLGTVEDSLAAFLGRNRSIGAASELVFERDRLQRRVEIQRESVLSLLRSLERLRIEQARDLPLVRVVEDPAGAAVPAPRPALATLTFLGLLVGGIFGVVLAFGAELVERIRTEDRPDHVELRERAGRIRAGMRQAALGLARARRTRTGASPGGVPPSRPDRAPQQAPEAPAGSTVRAKRPPSLEEAGGGSVR